MSLTNLRFRIMTAIIELGVKLPLGCASPAEVAEKSGLGSAERVRYIMRELLKIGWIERPYRGCYRLTDEGRKVLREAAGK